MKPHAIEKYTLLDAMLRVRPPPGEARNLERYGEPSAGGLGGGATSVRTQRAVTPEFP